LCAMSGASRTTLGKLTERRPPVDCCRAATDRGAATVLYGIRSERQLLDQWTTIFCTGGLWCFRPTAPTLPRIASSVGKRSLIPPSPPIQARKRENTTLSSSFSKLLVFRYIRIQLPVRNLLVSRRLIYQSSHRTSEFHGPFRPACGTRSPTSAVS